MYEPLINESFFLGPLTVGQSETTHVSDELNMYIRQHEQSFLTKLMGAGLKDAFVNGMKGEGIQDRWKKLAYGHTFTWDPIVSKFGLSGQKQQVSFTGLVCNEAEGDNQMPFNSPIAQYVWFVWQQQHPFGTGGTGPTFTADKKKAYIVDRNAFAAQWNRMADTCAAFYAFMDMNAADYPEFTLATDQWWYPAFMNPLF